MKHLVAAAVAAVLASACQTVPPHPMRAAADLHPTVGNKASGQATFEQVDGKVRVVVNVQGLVPGRAHGFHIHEAGDCSSGDAMSTKGHFNPTGQPHGHPSKGQSHAGDLPTIVADKTGRGRLQVEVDQITVTAGPTSIVGRGLVIHADPDDYQSQPAGNSGARIACGVIRQS